MFINENKTLRNLVFELELLNAKFKKYLESVNKETSADPFIVYSVYKHENCHGIINDDRLKTFRIEGDAKKFIESFANENIILTRRVEMKLDNNDALTFNDAYSVCLPNGVDKWNEDKNDIESIPGMLPKENEYNIDWEFMEYFYIVEEEVF